MPAMSKMPMSTGPMKSQKEMKAMKAMKTMKAMKATKSMKTQKATNAKDDTNGLQVDPMPCVGHYLVLRCQTPKCTSWIWLHRLYKLARCTQCNRPWISTILKSKGHMETKDMPKHIQEMAIEEAKKKYTVTKAKSKTKDVKAMKTMKVKKTRTIQAAMKAKNKGTK